MQLEVSIAIAVAVPVLVVPTVKSVVETESYDEHESSSTVILIVVRMYKIGSDIDDEKIKEVGAIAEPSLVDKRNCNMIDRNIETRSRYINGCTCSYRNRSNRRRT